MDNAQANRQDLWSPLVQPSYGRHVPQGSGSATREADQRDHLADENHHH